ncbi:Alcohol dehydrogenase zinc-binding domain protein [Gemmatirosa kalamazoonensis]|uniref:Alcohol dehydrogenase zinc-binding domain protein n=1 Tax=Gemmatirosa kalamazoonensis TaxID=861299 RepID=W0RHM2_9BACT|nr:zinc-binding dehydrogenase [Gemmatirosa kalamazoonensis]AHG89927.1 Alcohol dehydrogenase zinc-binding domain protein [Gemmatirosa kalamazoonensis]
MRALTLSAHGTLDQLEYRDDLPIPELREPSDVKVRVEAAALNHLDLFVVGGLPNVAITPPWIVGSDGAGIVEAVGASVTTVRPGDRVIVNPGTNCGVCEYCLDGEQPLCPRYRIYGEHLPGFLAEYVVVPERNVRAVPLEVAPESAAAFTLATLTAWRMLVTRAELRPGDEVLIWGIGGGVALAALQIAKRFGATVWVTSGSDDKLARARALGADHTLNHRTDDVPRVIRDRTGKRGVDVVVDNVGEATWSRSLQALGRRGRLVTCGATSGPMVQTDVRRLFWNQWNILGSTMGNDAEFAAIAAELSAGRLLPPIDSVWPLADGRRAYERLASGEQFGKVVVRIGAGT